MAKAITIKETTRGMAICETTPRYDVYLYGEFFYQLYFNTRGYVGYLPTPDGRKLYLPEGSIGSYRKEIVRLNKEFAALEY